MGRGGVRLVTIARVGVVATLSLTLAHCGKSSRVDPRYGVAASPRVVEPGEPVPKGGGKYSVGKPYVVAGRTYVPEERPDYKAEGVASWYGDDFHGRLTANGEVFDMQSIAAAHPTLPLPSYVRVTNLRNHRSLIVRVNDRGPYHDNRLIDVSVRAARLLDFQKHGTTRVRVEYVGRAALEGSDDVKLAATLRQGTPAPSPGVMVASAGPFVPEFFDPRPVTSREPVPTPPERPFELGAERGSSLAARRVATTAEVAHLGPPPQSAPRAPESSRTQVATAPLPPPRTQIAAAPLPPGRAQVQAAALPPAAPSSAPSAPVRTAAAPAHSESFASRFGATGPAPVVNQGPVSAFAPAASGSVLSGRGLY